MKHAIGKKEQNKEVTLGEKQWAGSVGNGRGLSGRLAD